jgi:hypothetical protein
MGRKVRKTVLICCEGKADKAFIEYIGVLYNSGRENPPKVTVKQAGGKGGNNVLDTLFGTMRHTSPDVGVVLLDADCPPLARHLKEARRLKIRQVVVVPCLEGLLLKLLGQNVPAVSAECKQRMRQIDTRDPFADGFFSDNFSKGILDARRQEIPELDALICCFDA